jgi:cytochrome c-type biogenesis protein CcmH/NrfG
VRHPDDPRALLLLARAYTDAGWYGDAVDRYRRAARLDPTSRHDPRMLGDLLGIVAADPQVSRRAAGAVRDVFGRDALAEIDRRVPSAADDAARARLQRLRDELSGL